MNDIRFNPLKTRQDLVKAALQLIDPVVSCLSPGNYRILFEVGLGN